MPSQSEVLSLIDHAYAAAEEPAAWPDFLERLSTVLNSRLTVLMYQDLGQQSATIGAAVRIDPSALQLYGEHYAERNVFFNEGRRQMVSGAVLTDAIVSRRTLLESEYFNDFLKPNDVRYSAAVVMRNEGGVVSMLSTMRSERAGEFGDEQLEVLGILRPHLQRGLEIRRRLYTLEQRLNLSSETLDRLDVGVVILNENGKVMTTNRRATRVLGEADGLACDRGTLHAADPRANRALQKLIGQSLSTARGDSIQPGGGVLVPRREGRRPYHVLVSPLGTGGRNVVVLIEAPAEKPEACGASIAELYGLTRAERSVVEGLLAGHSIEEIARGQSVALSTVRTHLKRIFVKTATHRQAELVALLKAMSLSGR